MENEPSSTTTLAEFYRLAVLLTGNIGKAEQVMAETLAVAERECAGIRNETSRRAWFVTRIRERIASEDAAPIAPRLLREDEETTPLEVLEIEAYLVAQRFHQLPEPGRTALALFYLDSFTNEDIAKVLKIREEELAGLLESARSELEAQLRASRSLS